MEPSPQTPEELLARLELPDRVSIRRWFAFYGVLLVVAGVWLAILVSQVEWKWGDPLADAGRLGWKRWVARIRSIYLQMDWDIELLLFAIYLSLCTTFIPLPTGAVTSWIALPKPDGPGLWEAVFIVSLVGATATTVANLNDYHLFTWMLRNRKIASVRHTRLHRVAARWFARHPFLILVIFNIIHIPIDVIRMLAATDRYGRARFAASNFVGRFFRYGLIAFVTYRWDVRWMPLALLGLGAVLGIGSLLAHRRRRIRERRDKPQAPAAV